MGVNHRNVLELLNLFSENEFIEELDLSSNNFGCDKDINFNCSWRVIEKNKKLKLIDLSSNFIGRNEDHLKKMENVFKVNKTLEYLSLSNNFIVNSQKGFQLLLDSLVENNLTTLDLSNNKIGINEEIFKIFTSFLGKTKNLTIKNLILSGCFLGSTENDDELKEFFCNLKNLLALKKMKIDNNIPKEYNKNYFLKNFNLFLNDNRTIEEVDLSINNIGLDMDNIKTFFNLLTFFEINNLN